MYNVGPRLTGNRPAKESWISVHEIPTDNFTLKLPFSSSTGDRTIKWGDGTVEINNSPEPQHQYESAGRYIIVVNGGTTNSAFEGDSSWKQSIARVSSWGELGWTSFRNLFKNVDRNFAVPNYLPSTVTNLEGMFERSNFNGDISSWNTSSVTTIHRMFLNSTEFNQPIGNWDTSSVIDMSNSFTGAESFNQDISLWDTSSVQDMSVMFNGATSFNQPIGNWDTSNVTNMNSMFERATAFNQPIGDWDTSSVTETENMFNAATAFNQPIGSWDTSSMSAMSLMFAFATSFNQPIGDWDMSSAQAINAMFFSADSFNQPIGNWNTSNVETMRSMFYGADSFNQPIGNWDTSSVTDMRDMFSFATSFNQVLTAWDVSNIPEEPDDFANNSLLSEEFKPIWGTTGKYYYPLRSYSFGTPSIDTEYTNVEPNTSNFNVVALSAKYTVATRNNDITEKTELVIFDRINSTSPIVAEYPDLDDARSSSNFAFYVYVHSDTVYAADLFYEFDTGLSVGRVHIIDAKTGLITQQINGTDLPFEDEIERAEFGSHIVANSNYLCINARRFRFFDNSTNLGAIFVFDQTDYSLLYTIPNPLPLDGSNYDLGIQKSVITKDNILIAADETYVRTSLTNIFHGITIVYDLDNQQLVWQAQGSYDQTTGGNVQVGKGIAAINADYVLISGYEFPPDETSILNAFGFVAVHDLQTGLLVKKIYAPQIGKTFGRSIAADSNFIYIDYSSTEFNDIDTVFRYKVDNFIQGYSLSDAEFDNISLDVSSKDSINTGTVFSNDGTKMFTVGYSNDQIHQYSLSTAFDLSTASDDNISFNVSSQEGLSLGLTLNNDGTKLYIVGAQSDRIRQYSLGTANDLSTISYDNVSFNVSSQDVLPQSITFNDNGTKMYIVGVDQDQIHQYSLGVAFDLSTASYDSVSFDVSSEETSPRSITFNDNGTKIFICGFGSRSVHQYSVSTPYDVSTASYDNISFNVSSESTIPQSINFNNNGTKMYITESDGLIYQYSTSSLTQPETLIIQSFNDNAKFMPNDAVVIDNTVYNLNTDPTSSVWKQNHMPLNYEVVGNEGIYSDQPITVADSMFKNMAVYSDIQYWNTAEITSMSSMFANSDINEDIGLWNTSNVTDMSNMFEDASSFNQDLTEWDVSNIPQEPDNFATGSALEPSNYPIWGTTGNQ